MNEIIGGTVIQRSFVGREATNVVHIATVPVSELGLENASLEIIVADTLGIPRHSLLDAEAYADVVELLRRYPQDYFFPYFEHPRLHRYFKRLHDLLREDNAPAGLFNDFVSVAGDASNVSLPLMPFFSFPTTDLASQLELSPQALSAALRCIAARAGRTSQAEHFLNEIYRYDIPLGQSPKVKSDSLLQLLDTSKKVCIAPLAIGGAHAVSQLTQGSYVAALLTTGTAGVMTLVLIGTVSVGALIVQRVAQARARSEQSSESNTPPAAPTRRRRQAGGGKASAA